MEKFSKKKGELGGAIVNYKTAIQINSRDIDSVNSLGALLFNQGEIEKARPYFERAIQLDPKYYRAHRNLGLVFLSEGKFHRGLEALKRAMDLHPTFRRDSSFLYQLAHANHKLGRHRKAISLLERSIQLDPDHEPSHAYLGQVRNGVQSIIQQIRADIKKYPNDPELFLLLGNQYFFLGEKIEAIKHYRKSVALDPGFPQGWIKLSILSVENGYYEKAIQFYRNYLELISPSGENFYHLACLYGLSHRNDQALESLRKALRLAPSLIEKALKDPRLKSVSSTADFREMLKSF